MARRVQDCSYLLIAAGYALMLFLYALASSGRESTDVWLLDRSRHGGSNITVPGDITSGSGGAVRSCRRTFFAATLLSALAAMLWLMLFFVPQAKHRVLQFSQAAAGALLTANAIILLADGRWVLAGLLLLVVVGDTLWMARARANGGGGLQFVEVLLDVVLRAIRANMVIVWLLAACMVLQTGFLMLWSAALVEILRAGRGDFMDFYDFVIMTFAMRFFPEIFKGMMRFTVGGAVSDWLKAASKQAASAPSSWDPDNAVSSGGAGGDGGLDAAGAAVEETVALTAGAATATGAAATTGAGARSRSSGAARAALRRAALTYFRHACTVQLGTVAKGAFFGTFTPLVWAVLRVTRRAERVQNAPVSRTAARLTRGFDACLRASHKYAHVQAATHGKLWIPAAHDTWEAFRARGVEAVVQADMTDRLLQFGAYVGGGVMSLVTGVTLDAGVRSWVLVAFVVFWIGMAAVSLALTPVEAAVSALFVSFAETPDVLSQCNPIVFHRLVRISELRHFESAHQDRQ